MKKEECIITFDSYTAEKKLFGYYQIKVSEYEYLKIEQEKKQSGNQQIIF